MIIASIDIGSNTVLMLVANVIQGEGKIIRIRDEQRIPRISEGLTGSGRISEVSIKRLNKVLKEYFQLAKYYKCEKILITGTSAFRNAVNSQNVKDLIERNFKTELNILSGKEEAQLSFMGTMNYAGGGENRLVIDIGGGSTEIIYGTENNIQFLESFEIGVVSLSEKYSDKILKAEFKPDDHLKNYLGSKLKLLQKVSRAPDKVFALAGTPVTLACIHKGLKKYEEKIVEGYRLSRDNMFKLSKYISGFTPVQLLKKYPGLVTGREDLILSGTYILLYIMELLKLDKVIVSTYGIRYGAILKFLMSQDHR